MRTLSIGNSFSQDACAYLHQTAESLGLEWECVNLYIGGCSLERHCANLESGAADYDLEINGRFTGRKISIPDALSEFPSDVITLQQASHFSGKRETYYPYIETLADAVRKVQPDAELYIHETWAYETDSTHGAFPDYGKDQHKMYELLKNAYTEAASVIKAGIIPVGDAVQHLRDSKPEFDYINGGMSLCRDGFHLNIPYGRMLASYVWIRTLAGKEITDAGFVPEGADVNILNAVKNGVNEALNSLNA